MVKSIFLKAYNKAVVFMIPIKVILTGLAGVSLCMANISGIVTDTGTTPIPGAVVQLEKGGQKDTTDADGRFTLVIGTTEILSGASKLLLNGLSARITRNLMTVMISEKAAVEVATFDLSGKALSIVRKTMDAGSHSLSLPYQGAGIYLYKVKSGNRECVLKGNAVGGIPYGSSVTTSSPASNVLSKQAKATAAISDVIAATMPGWLNYRCVIGNSDTSGVVIKMIANAGDMTDADGNVYQSVRIGNQVWMAENLRVTRYNDGSAIPLDTSTAPWWTALTPKYCFFNNTTNPDSIKKYGALYNWYVVNPLNPKKIAPTGWHVPSDAEWDTLQNYLIANGYNRDGTTTGNKIAKSMAAQTDWSSSTSGGIIGNDLSKNNASGFSALPGGARYDDGYFINIGSYGYWRSATEFDASSAWFRILGYSYFYLRRSSNTKSWGFSVRLLRDN
jgi:uncharacterized protein (TIGR02145 family)